MDFRKAVQEDVSSIMNIIRQAQDYLRGKGIDQWQNNYPNPDIVINDINNKNAYVLVKDNIVAATVTVSIDGEETYKEIYSGEWLCNQKYAVIHRLAVESGHKGSGLSSIILKRIEEMCLEMGIHSTRVDTHEENAPMLRLLQKSGFQYCGVIFLEDKSKRLAFEKLI